ncbi:hypothetical protein Scep_004452 [Stephania cephalantha]|uniref:Uncharacterized protein n=1 Tax=Stephania cephalantha TaxID=152367 RepID=A0AAP0KTX4_9MAGN
MDPSTLLFLLKRNLHLMGLHPGGRSTSSQVLLPIIESISSFNASFRENLHLFLSLPPLLFEDHFRIKTIRNLSSYLFLYFLQLGMYRNRTK